MEHAICDGFRAWVKEPIKSDFAEKSVSFDWAVLDENEIPFYANMWTDDPGDEIDIALYERVAQATHYIALSEYSIIVADCLGLNETRTNGEVLSYHGTYKSKEVSVFWGNRNCHLDEIDGMGCFTITKK